MNSKQFSSCPGTHASADYFKDVAYSRCQKIGCRGGGTDMTKLRRTFKITKECRRNEKGRREKAFNKWKEKVLIEYKGRMKMIKTIGSREIPVMKWKFQINPSKLK